MSKKKRHHPHRVRKKGKSFGRPSRRCAAASGWALYRPDGTLMHVYQGEMTPERADSILSRAWDEIRPHDYHAAGTPIPRATDDARRLGYRVVAVTITPNKEYQP